MEARAAMESISVDTVYHEVVLAIKSRNVP
jgi:hypothetical protein